MTKSLIPKQQLIDIINISLHQEWRHKDSHCKVSELRQVALPDRNWEVTTTNTGGDFRHVEECEALKKRILSELVKKYNVQW